VTPEIVNHLLAKAGFKVVKTSSVPKRFKESDDEEGPAQGNIYYGQWAMVKACFSLRDL
jgi:hypothetical protein